jgi:hypothetical protein
MNSLTNQLIEDIRGLFQNREDEYNKVIVKEIYNRFPKGYYPKVTIEEIDNDEIVERTTTQGERTTLLSYQITCYSRDMQQYDAVQSVKFMANLIDEYLAEHYQMKRLTNANNLKPYIYDQTVMTVNLRYSCIYDKETNLIYKYYKKTKYYNY